MKPIVDYTIQSFTRVGLAVIALWSLGILVPQHPLLGNLLVFTEGFRAFPLLHGLCGTVVVLAGLLPACRGFRRLTAGAAVAVLATFAAEGWRSPEFALPGGTQARASDVPALTVGAANLEFGLADGAVLFSRFGSPPPDLLVVTEVTQEWIDRSNIGQLYPYRFELPGRYAEGTAVYSTRPISDAEKLDVPRMFGTLMVTVPAAGGELVRVFAVHAPPPQGDLNLKHRTEYLRRVTEAIAQLPSDMPVVIAGDLNTTPFSDGYMAFVSANGLTHSAAPRFLPATWRSRSFGAFIDHVLTRGLNSQGTFEILGGIRSDHFPVVTKLYRERH